MRSVNECIADVHRQAIVDGVLLYLSFLSYLCLTDVCEVNGQWVRSAAKRPSWL